MQEKLSDLCRDQKQTINPRKTNQDIAEHTDLSVGTVAQFFRGDIKNPSVYTVGPICREMGVSMDDYFEIPRPVSNSDTEALRAENAQLQNENEALRAENTALHTQITQHLRSIRMHRIVTLILLAILSLCALALLVDVMNPNVGWVRAAAQSLAP